MKNISDKQANSSGIYEQNEFSLAYTVEDGKATITGAIGKLRGELIIPESIDGCKVTCISQNAFRGCVGLTNVTIPDSVTDSGLRTKGEG